MLHRNSAAVPWGFLLGCLVLCFALFPATVWGQQAQGTISVAVVDPTGGVIPGAQLKLVDVATNDTRTAKTLENGTYSFMNLKVGSYKLTVSRSGFSTQVYTVEAMAGRVTDLKAELVVGKTEEVVEVVGTATPLVESSSNAVNMTITPNQIENLPLSGRNVVSMAYLSAGYNGTWNGMPTTAQGSSIDGVVGSSGRWKYSTGADGTAVTPRLETIEEMTVSSGQLDLANGFGTSNMTITYVTKRGTNDYHGKLFEDFRNSALNAKSWNLSKNGKKSRLILNEFGASVGGPVLKDKLFFFGSFSMSKRPGSFDVYQQYFNQDAQKGLFTWKDNSGTQHQVNLYNVVNAYNAANPTATVSTTPSAAVQTQLAHINSLLSKGVSWNTGGGDPNVSGLTWKQSSGTTYYYPTVRFDYNLSQKHRLYFSYNQTDSRLDANSWAGGWLPGDNKAGGYWSDNLTSALGLESTLTPTLVNQFKLGYMYSASAYPSKDTSYNDAGAQIISWNYGSYFMSGQTYNLPNSRMQPVFSISDDMTWMKGKHTVAFGFSAYRDQNKYWNSLDGIPTINLGIDGSDHNALNALTKTSLATDGVELTDTALSNARALFAVLTARVSGINGMHAYNSSTGAYDTGKSFSKLNELMRAWGLYVQDSYKIKSNLTLNYGLRWDFVGPDKDLTGMYHSMTPDDIWAYSGVWNLFNPSYTAKGTMNPVATARKAAYDSWNVTPQPAFGFAWTPRSEGTFIEKLLGGDKTVLRGGYSLRRFTEPQQLVWAAGSNGGFAFEQYFRTSPSNTAGTGTFTPGSLTLDGLSNKSADYFYSPATYQKSIPMTEDAFSWGQYVGIDPHIRQPYTQSWNIGFQREIGRNRALEVRYVGNRSIHQWLSLNINQVNTTTNGFLQEFKQAQQNLAANGGKSFAGANGSMSGLPIMQSVGLAGTESDRINDLQHGAVGNFAGALTSRDYFCTMVGGSFPTCANAGFTGAATQPANLFVANPFAIDHWLGARYMTDAGYSNYNALQVEVRQQQWHGLSYTANYTWSKTLGMSATDSGDNWTGSNFTQYDIGDLRASYGPAQFDRQHVININASFDLPFGKGKKWLNQSSLLDRIVGGWTVGSIYGFKTGVPFRVAGLYYTYNDQVDGGVVLNGVTASDIQKHVGVHYVQSSNPKTASTVYFIDPAYAKSLINDKKIVSNETPGTWGRKLWLHGPHSTTDDIAITKAVPVTERVRFRLQAEFINAFNHPVFKYSNTSIDNANAFGQGSYSGSPRLIEFRANLEF